jgi:signal transduction histidine kinase/CheY-like chemotaxis protein
MDPNHGPSLWRLARPPFVWQWVFLALVLAVVAALGASVLHVWLNIALVLGIGLLGIGLLGLGLTGRWTAQTRDAPIDPLGDVMQPAGALQVQDSRAVPGAHPAWTGGSPDGAHQGAAASADSHQALQMRIAEAVAELARKNQELELASQAKTQLLAAASHDLRQPLYALTLFSDSLADGETDPQRLQRIGYVRECVQSLDRLFSELLNLSQFDAGVLHPQWTDFPLDQLFDELNRNFRPIAEQKNLRLVIRKTDVWVRSDYVMLSRILGNLVSNSLRYTRHGGLLIGARRRGREIRIDVADTGMGIAPEHQRRVFEEFYQVNPQPSNTTTRGMGLGLTTVQRLSGLLSCRVQLTSTLDKGTYVRVNVPAVAAIPPAEPTAEAAAEAEPSLAGLRVLVIDDEYTILEALQMVLSSWGMQVLMAHSRAEAIVLADGWTQCPDIILSDLLLQNGENGLDLLAALEQHPHGIGPHTACLLITGETQPERLRQAMSTSIAILYKPVSPCALRQAIIAQLTAVRESMAPA